MRYPEKLLSPGESVVTEFRPHWSSILREGTLSVLVLVLIVIIAFMDFSWRGWLIVGLVVAWFALIIRGVVRWWSTLHVVTNERLIYRAGLIAKSGKEIPLEVINDVTFNQVMWERVLGTGDLVIESAGEHGQTLFTDIPNPEGVQSLVYQERERRKLELEGGGGRAADESTASQLATLARLHDEGKLTDNEFESQKARLLGGE
ncbi:MAG: PH domain-containing protein [Acidimicrobiia bacterium]